MIISSDRWYGAPGGSLVTQGPDAVHYPYLMLSHGYSFTIRLTTDELNQ